jgi:[protein-PII] uridylyltransferase
VSRPDLLLLGALVHDIGKGLPGDHSQVGARIAERIAERWGLPVADRQIIVRLVAQHLVLTDTATRRDLDDPATVTAMADAVGHSGLVLDLLHAITEADAAATGPAAWSSWKARLIGELVQRTHALLGAGTAPPLRPLAESVAAAHRIDPASIDPADPPIVRINGDEVLVIAPSGGELLSATAGVLALHRLDVYAADAGEFGEKAAVVVLQAAPRFGSPPDPALLAADLRRALRGGLEVGAQLGRRESRDEAPPSPPRVLWLQDIATDATVLELRTADRRGLLYRVTAALEAVAAPARAARVSTFGAHAVDAFYLVGDYSDPARRAAVERAVLAAAAPQVVQPE